MISDPDLILEAQTPVGFRVRVTRKRWELIIRDKHPVMHGEETMVRSALETPDEIRQSRSDSSVCLFYKAQRAGRWICVVTKRTGDDGFLITAYPTDAIKEGTRVWPT